MSDQAPALRLEGVGYAYERGRPVLHGVGFEVPHGSFTALLGPNGAGKTTLMALITRLFDPGSGTIEVAGIDLRRRSTRALAGIGVVFQQPTLDLDLTVRRNLLYAGDLHGLPRATTKTRVEALLEDLALTDRAKATVRSLSGGLRRRVEIARALLHEPTLLVLDEATVGLDIESRRWIVDRVHDLARDTGLAILWTTHLVDEVRPEDRVVVLHQGQVLARGKAASVVDEQGAADLGQAFTRLVGKPLKPGPEPTLHGAQAS